MRKKLINILSNAHNSYYSKFDPSADYFGALADGLIANGVTVQKWIPVTERLPELRTKVLCCGVKGGRFIAELSTWGKEEHLYWDKRNGQGCPTVTHWMPLPEPPKGE